MAIPTRAEVDVIIRARVAADPEFRTRLLAVLRATVSEAVGFDRPDAVSVEVHEETLTNVHLVQAPTGTRSAPR